MREKEVAEFRAKTGVRNLLEIPLRTDFPPVRRPKYEIPTVRPVLVVADGADVARAQKIADDWYDKGRPTLVVSPRKDDGATDTAARRAEDVLVAARYLSQAVGGRSVVLIGVGSAIPCATWAQTAEWPYFTSFFTEK